MKKAFSSIFLFVVAAFLYAPIVLVIVYSFSGNSNFTFTDGINFDAYLSIFTSDKTPKLLEALRNTMLIAVISSVISTILGTVSAIGIYYLNKRSRRVVESINQLPMINSEMVMAVSLMIFFVTFTFPEGYLRLIIAHVSFCTPYVVLSVMPKLEQMDPNIYEAALDLGAGPVRAMTTVVVPILTPGIISGFVMAFTISMDDFIITEINKGATTGIETLSTYIYHDARVQGLEPFWFAVFSIIFVVVLAILLFVNLHKVRKEQEEVKV
ncbi:MAG: ABC transporter permease [Clostridia bacterium]|nr:ABC transporter permease [Clostridia bacterium]MBR7159690.1 ABC transporter permease [Clostridia bacterium]